MRALSWIFKVKNSSRNALHIIGWWEVRRPVYNVIVLVCGILSMRIASLLLAPTSFADDSGMVVSVFWVLCNVCYTFGWIIEIILTPNPKNGPRIFKFGLLFTLFWVFLPAIIDIVFWVAGGFKRVQ